MRVMSKLLPQHPVDRGLVLWLVCPVMLALLFAAKGAFSKFSPEAMMAILGVVILPWAFWHAARLPELVKRAAELPEHDRKGTAMRWVAICGVLTCFVLGSIPDNYSSGNLLHLKVFVMACGMLCGIHIYAAAYHISCERKLRTAYDNGRRGVTDAR